MNSSDQNPSLPTWLFIVVDVALLAVAALLALLWRPLDRTGMLLIVGCVGAGAIFGLLPLIARYERQKNEALDDRQRALEALARTLTSSAEQISIAAGGLHEIAELAQKNLRQAEQLPHKLQDKIAEFQAQLAVVEDAEKEELERELLSLRTSESERLESVSQRIAKSTAEWVKLEAATQQHLTAAQEALAKLSLGTAAAIGKAQAAAEQALGHARVEAARALGEASGQGVRDLDAARTAALAALDAKLAAAGATVADQLAGQIATRLAAASQALDEKISRLETAARLAATAPAPAPAPAAIAPSPSPAPAPEDTAPAGATPPPVGETPDAPADPALPAPAAPAKRSRKPRREEPAPDATTEDPPAATSPDPEPAPAPEPAHATVATPPEPPAPEPDPAPPADEPAPVTPEKFAEITPIAPHTAEPFAAHLSDEPSSTADAAPPAPAAPDLTPPPEVPAATEEPKPLRKRPAARKPEPAADSEPGLGLELDDTPHSSAASVAERVLTSDGATRLLVTAYIGIGNRLFIRGEGPGLSWEKGVPLQFVSIGKWRWETNDASGPVQFKLYKNDDLECAALGAQTLDPGHQQEVTAAF